MPPALVSLSPFFTVLLEIFSSALHFRIVHARDRSVFEPLIIVALISCHLSSAFNRGCQQNRLILKNITGKANIDFNPILIISSQLDNVFPFILVF